MLTQELLARPSGFLERVQLLMPCPGKGTAGIGIMMLQPHGSTLTGATCNVSRMAVNFISRLRRPLHLAESSDHPADLPTGMGLSQGNKDCLCQGSKSVCMAWHGHIVHGMACCFWLLAALSLRLDVRAF